MKHEHPDANLLAAFTERRLSSQEREDLFAHLAECAECREIVTLASAPAAVAPARAISHGWRWAAGIAAAALVLTGTWGLRLMLKPPQTRNTPAVIAMTGKTDSAHSLPPPAAIASQPEIAPAPRFASPAAVGAPKQKEAARGRFIPRQLVTPVPNSAVARPLAERIGAAAAKGFLSRPQVLWSVADHLLERSLDGGTSWQPVPLGEGAEFYAAASQDSNVWAGGSRGMLFHSSDAGASWTEVKVGAGGKTLRGTIVAIRLPDASQVILETDSNQQWISRDGGTSWKRL